MADRLSYKNRVVNFIGGMFLEIYICHGLFLKIYSNKFMIENGVLYGTAVFVSTVVLALVIRPLFQLILNWHRK